MFDKVTSWPQLISKFVVAPTYTLFATLLLIGLAPFLHPRCFYLVYIYIYTLGIHKDAELPYEYR